MKYSDIKLNFKFNKLKNLLYFENWEKDYQDHLTLKFDPEYFSNYNSSIPGFLIDNNIFRLKELTKDVLKDHKENYYIVTIIFLSPSLNLLINQI